MARWPDTSSKYDLVLLIYDRLKLNSDKGALCSVTALELTQ